MGSYNLVRSVLHDNNNCLLLLLRCDVPKTAFLALSDRDETRVACTVGRLTTTTATTSTSTTSESTSHSTDVTSPTLTG